MKIRGRFIGILAVLGLLIALVPLAPAGAVAGSVTLKGGADNNGLFYSDKSDLQHNHYSGRRLRSEPGQAGCGAGYGTQLAALVWMLVEYVIGGESEETEKFDGGPENNPVCDADGDGPARG